MRLGYNTNGFAHHRIEDAIGILAEIGYKSVALTLDHYALNPFAPELPQQIDRVRVILKRHGLHSVIETGARFLLDPRLKHHPTLMSAAAQDRERRMHFLRRAIDIAAMLGSDAVSFWSGALADSPGRDAAMEQLVRGCRALLEHAASRSVRLAFEPEPGMFIDRMQAYEELAERLDHRLFGLTIDLGHVHCLDDGPIPAVLERWSDGLWNVHIEDMRRGVHDHLMFGEGEIDFPPVLAKLTEIGYSGGLHVELSRHSHDAVRVARQSYDFLRAAMTARPQGSS